MDFNFLGMGSRKGSDEPLVQAGSAELVSASYVGENASPSSGPDIYKKISLWSIYIGIFLLPLFSLPWTTSILELNKQLLLVAVSSVALVSWLLGVVSSGVLSWRKNYLNLPILAFALAFALASVFSVSRFRSFFGTSGNLSESLIVILSLVAFYLAAVNVVSDKGRKLISILSLSLLLALVFGILQVLGIYLFNFSFLAARTFNTIGSINSLGVAAAVALPLFSKFRFQRGVFGRLNPGKLGVIISIAILALINWWVLWAVAISGMVALISFGSVNRDKFRISKFMLPMLVIIIAIFLMIINFNLAPVKSNLPVEIGPGFSLSWQVVSGVMRENFVFGYGPENFSLAFDKYGAGALSGTTVSSLRFFDSTSQVLNFFVSGGIILVVAFGFLLASVIWTVVKKIRDSQLSPRVESVLASLAAVIAAIFLYPFGIVMMFIFFILLAIMVLSLWGEDIMTVQIEERASLSLVSSLGFIGGLILVLVGGYFGGLIYLSEIKYAQALRDPNPEGVVEKAGRAIGWNGSDSRFYRTVSQAALAIVSEEIRKDPGLKDPDSQDRAQNNVSLAIDSAVQATQIEPNEVNNWINLGSVYENLIGLINGVDKLSESAYLKASELRPGDPGIRNRVGSMYLAKAGILNQIASRGGANVQEIRTEMADSLAQAESNYKQVIEMSPNFGLAIYNLGVVYERQGRLKEAIGQLEKVAPFNTNQPNLAFELGLLYYRDDQKDKSFEQLQRAVLLSPSFSNARWYLGLIYEERGELDQAIGQLEKIINVEANKNNAAVLNKLEELRAGKVSIPPEAVLDQRPL